MRSCRFYAKGQVVKYRLINIGCFCEECRKSMSSQNYCEAGISCRKCRWSGMENVSAGVVVVSDGVHRTTCYDCRWEAYLRKVGQRILRGTRQGYR